MEKIKLIAHRGLLNGPDASLENTPAQIYKALECGFDAEIDLWVENNNFFLGHDAPQYPILSRFCENPGLWIHAKNLESLYWLSQTSLNYFWHQNDDRVITSHGYIWTYPEKELTDRSIRLMPEWKDPDLTDIKSSRCFGICSDYVQKIKTIFQS